MDYDTCTGQDGWCSFWYNQAENGIRFVSWSDNGAGGQFGYMENGVFVPSNDVNRISHYKTPATPGQVTLSLTVDDIPQAIDPATNQLIATADDPQKTGNKEITVWKIERPLDGDKFAFGPDGSNYCDVIARASTSVMWSIDGISGSNVIFPDGNPMQAGRIRYNGLPTENSQFGEKRVFASKGNRMDSRTVKIFFNRDAFNHGIAQTDPPEAPNWINWFYYWRQTSAGANYWETIWYDHNLRDRNGNFVSGMTYFHPSGEWRSYIGRNGNTSSGVNYWQNANGIDFFAWVVRHELFHRAHLVDDWGAHSGIRAAEDTDDDYLRDDAEYLKIVVADNTDGTTHLAGYRSDMQATYPDHFGYGRGWTDSEDWCLHNQGQWTNGAANHEDWASPGKQW